MQSARQSTPWPMPPLAHPILFMRQQAPKFSAPKMNWTLSCREHCPLSGSASTTVATSDETVCLAQAGALPTKSACRFLSIRMVATDCSTLMSRDAASTWAQLLFEVQYSAQVRGLPYEGIAMVKC